MPSLSPSRSRSTDSSRSPSYTGRDETLMPLFAQMTFFIVPAKLDVALVDAQISALGGKRVGMIEDARVVVTALRGRPRIERALGAGSTKLPNLVSVAYVSDTYDCAKAGEDLPPRSGYLVFPARERSRSRSVEVVEKKRRRSWESSIEVLEAMPAKRARINEGEHAHEDRPLPDVVPRPENVKLGDIPRMCVERACPLVCPNQDIIDAIRPIYLYREFDESDQKNTNVLSYRRSVSMLKSVPRRLKSGAEALKLMDVGDKVRSRINEYLTTGAIAESAEILASERYNTLRAFASIYSVGTSTAVELWNAGCRSLADVRAHYCRGHEDLLTAHDRRAERKAAQRRAEGRMTRAEVVSAWLDLKDDLDADIPREEAEEIAHCVMQNVDALQPGCEWTIAGGYRRGKTAVSDVDVIISPPPGTNDKMLIKDLCKRMSTLGSITHVLHITTHDPTNPLHSHGANFDNLDKAFVILRLPKHTANAGSSSSLDITDGKMRRPITPTRTIATEPRRHRRVDIILAPRERYAAAVLSWSGSMMYERDLRRVAEDKGYKFRAGLIHATTATEVNLASEREILGFLGLPFVPPTLRNAE